MKLSRRAWIVWGSCWLSYIGWDVVAQRVLHARFGWLSGSLVDWLLVGGLGLLVCLVLQRRRKAHTNQPIVAAGPSRQTLINDQIAALAQSLGHSLAEINSEAGSAMTLEGIEQHRALRLTILATHRAQSLLDELAGLAAHPRFSAPPAHEMYHPAVLGHDELPGRDQPA